MTEKLYEALEVCIRALETGADLESVLKLYPQLESDLRPILETMQKAQSISAPEIPSEVMRRGRARVLQHAAEMRESSARKPKRKHFSLTRFATSMALALAFLLGGTSMVSASNGALPGDNLYPVKRSWEAVRLWFAFSPEGREKLESEYEQERLNEVDELLNEGREEVIAFYGIVTAQDGAYWLVSGVPVQLTARTQLPANPVVVGAPVTVVGRTNAQGFIEAQMVGALEAGVSLPPLQPTEFENESEESQQTEKDDFEAGHDGESESDFFVFEFSGLISSTQGTVWFINNQKVDVSTAEIKGILVVGDFVNLEGYYASDGSFIVTKIEKKSDTQKIESNQTIKDNSNDSGGRDDKSNGNDNTNDDSNDDSKNDSNDNDREKDDD